MDFSTVKKNLETLGYSVVCFETGVQAAEYLNAAIDGVTVGFGGSVTLDELGLYDLLARHNTVFWHWRPTAGLTDKSQIRLNAAKAEVYLCSVNGLAETGEIINIDSDGNRIASMIYGHQRVYLVVGKNKLAPGYDDALQRARNIAAPKNAQRLKRKTPCAAQGDKCYNCKRPERICRILSVLWEKPKDARCEVVLVNENLGY